MRLLLIDDDDDLRRIARLSLERIGGMTVSEANGGQAGFQLAKTELPDVILCDVMMPEMDGPATLAALREEPSTKEIPVIFLTAKATIFFETHSGVQPNAVLAKPFNPRTLADQVCGVLTESCNHDQVSVEE